MTSHGKIVMCNVAEKSINNAYNIEDHDLNLCTHLIYFESDNSFPNEADSYKSINFFAATSAELDELPKKSIYAMLPRIRREYPLLKVSFL